MFRRTLKEFQYIQASDIEEATSHLSDYGEEAQILAGGTDLIPLMKGREFSPSYVIDISTIEEMDFIEEEDESIRIGANTKIRKIAEVDFGKEWEALTRSASSIGDKQIRNVGTIGGNLCRAAPSGDLCTPPLSMKASAIAKKSGEESREISLEEYFEGPGQTALEPDEILTEIQIPKPVKGEQFSAFEKVTGRHEPQPSPKSIAAVNAAVVLRFSGEVCTESGVALGAVAPTPIRITEVEEKLEDELEKRKVSENEEIIEEASEIAKERVEPLTDVRSTAEYRREISGVLLERAISRILESATSSGGE